MAQSYVVWPTATDSPHDVLLFVSIIIVGARQPSQLGFPAVREVHFRNYFWKSPSMILSPLAVFASTSLLSRIGYDASSISGCEICKLCDLPL